MTFVGHLEYIFHITCSECKFYWTYATMEKSYNIEKREYYCPNCGIKKYIILQNEI
jgi:Zn finger protein HypA/HybF involved in hydrogenase expression